MFISGTILNALKRAVAKAGNPSIFAQKLSGVKQTTIRNWLLGITKTISEENWNKLKPLLREELTDVEDMHYFIDEIGPDYNLWRLLVEWKDMREDIKNKIIALTEDSVFWNSDVRRLNDAGLDILREDFRKAIFDKYGGLEGLVDHCNKASDNGISIYEEITALAIRSPNGMNWLLSKYTKAHNLAEWATANGIMTDEPVFQESIKKMIAELNNFPLDKPEDSAPLPASTETADGRALTALDKGK